MVMVNFDYLEEVKKVKTLELLKLNEKYREGQISENYLFCFLW